jgi:hypothetical protein
MTVYHRVSQTFLLADPFLLWKMTKASHVLADANRESGWCWYLFVFLALQPCGCIFHSSVAGFSLLILEVSWSHKKTRHSRKDSPGRVINPSQRPLPDNIQHPQQTNIHAPGEIRTHNLSGRAAVDLNLRPRGHWDRHRVRMIGTQN